MSFREGEALVYGGFEFIRKSPRNLWLESMDSYLTNSAHFSGTASFLTPPKHSQRICLAIATADMAKQSEPFSRFELPTLIRQMWARCGLWSCGVMHMHSVWQLIIDYSFNPAEPMRRGCIMATLLCPNRVSCIFILRVAAEIVTQPQPIVISRGASREMALDLL